MDARMLLDNEAGDDGNGGDDDGDGGGNDGDGGDDGDDDNGDDGGDAESGGEPAPPAATDGLLSSSLTSCLAVFRRVNDRVLPRTRGLVTLTGGGSTGD